MTKKNWRTNMASISIQINMGIFFFFFAVVSVTGGGKGCIGGKRAMYSGTRWRFPPRRVACGMEDLSTQTPARGQLGPLQWRVATAG